MRGGSPKARPPRRVLTPRDVDVLVALFKFRYLAASQVRRLHFPSLQTTTRRLRILAETGYVLTFRSPGVPDRVAYLTPKGLAAVADFVGVGVSDLGTTRLRTQPKDHYFLKHALAISDVRIALTLACASDPEVRLLGFFADHVAEVAGRGVVRRFLRDVAADVRTPEVTIGHTPDAVFALGHGEAAALFLTEVDRGTESVANRDRGFAKTLRFYRDYLRSGGFARYHDTFGVASFKTVRVLVLTSSRRRIETIRAVGASLGFEPSNLMRFVWLAETRDVDATTIFSLPWVSLDPTDAATYRIVRDRLQPVSAGERVES